MVWEAIYTQNNAHKLVITDIRLTSGFSSYNSRLLALGGPPPFVRGMAVSRWEVGTPEIQSAWALSYCTSSLDYGQKSNESVYFLNSVKGKGSKLPNHITDKLAVISLFHGIWYDHIKSNNATCAYHYRFSNDTDLSSQPDLRKLSLGIKKLTLRHCT